jgi:hypothetical protein
VEGLTSEDGRPQLQRIITFEERTGRLCETLAVQADEILLDWCARPPQSFFASSGLHFDPVEMPVWRVAVKYLLQ